MAAIDLTAVNEEALARRPHTTFPSLERIWTDLAGEASRENFRRWMWGLDPETGRAYTAEKVASLLRLAGVTISPSTITSARRNRWEPAS